MKLLFFVTFAVYAAAVALEFTGTAFRKEKLLRAAWIVFLAAFALHTVFFVARGVATITTFSPNSCPLLGLLTLVLNWTVLSCRLSDSSLGRGKSVGCHSREEPVRS